MFAAVAIAFLSACLSDPMPTAEAAPAAASTNSDDAVPAIKRHRPRRGEVELGVSAGVMLPSGGADLAADDATPQNLTRVVGDIGLRAGYYPLRMLGLEVEGNVMPGGRTRATDDPVMLWSVRGQVILQVPFWRVVPFGSIGAGGLGLSSDSSVLGRDVDGFGALGGGLKVHLTRLIGLRLDARVNLSQKRRERDPADSEEILLGLVVRLGGRPNDDAPRAPDRDHDGIADPEDACVDVPGDAPRGCPPDRDGDGVLDDTDRCPDDRGEAPGGCPGDRDRDGVTDDVDACPEHPGVPPDGCPPADRDADGVPDETDRCPDEPETVNRFEDADGCPDEVPVEVQKFDGVIEPVRFAFDSATIRKTSRERLDAAIEVMSKYPTLTVRISGHTDDFGDREHNLELSRRRAAAVKKHLVDAGIDPSRISIREVGSAEPVASNDTREGRAQNRRTEFEVISQ